MPTIFYIPFRTRTDKGLAKVPESERARFLLVEIALRREQQVNHSPHAPVELLEGSEIDLKDLLYIDVLDMYPYVPIEGTEVLGAIPKEGLEWVIALQKAVQTHKIPNDVQCLNVGALQEYFTLNRERENPRSIGRSVTFSRI
ncbi:uncharacterized protein N0V89_008214 [Didymosphaeria variabile]|uniref:Uncharacterized protein n=1 Tax=Didymosphaeria variabile TaxID=1932322 RepID=A0A9W9C8M5_9PLEO|nr:uncharacterized protein N0V89_008214 [Didymosphaeria variabile]KAJ4349598.1 hypothetical protein N0V89_008214 [Didymosphaeria variabile]